jgi:hypothetical protein
MDVATDHRTLDDSRHTGWWWRLDYRLPGSRKRAVLAAVTACRAEWRQKERHDELATRIDGILDEAEAQVKQGNIQAGWACFLAARRMRILDARSQRISAESIALLGEAEESPGWRGKVIRELLKPERQAEPENQRMLLYVAYEIRDEALQNAYRNVEILREQLLVLGGMLILVVFGLLAMAIRYHVDLTGSPKTERIYTEIVVYVALFGALGGSLSAIQWVTKASTTGARLPETRMRGPAVFMRPIFGVAAAIAVFPILVAGILDVQLKNNAQVFSVALVAGFSERLISYAVRTVPTGEGQDHRTSGV